VRVPEHVLAHKHCPECGTTIGLKEKYCSKDCERAHDERIRSKKRQLLYLYLGGVAMFALAMLLVIGRG